MSLDRDTDIDKDLDAVEDILLESKILLNALEHQRSKIEDTILELDQKLQSLSDTNFMLQSIPKKFTAQLESSVPVIIGKLKLIVLEELTVVKNAYSDDMSCHISFLKESEARIAKVSQDIATIDKKRIKMFFLGVTVSSIISVLCAIYASSYMIQRFPTRVMIDKPAHVTLYDSQVSVWGKDNIKTLPSVKSKTKK